MIDEEEFNLDRHPPRFVVEFVQNETESLGFVEVKDFMASGEVNESDILPVAIQAWNLREENVKTNVKAVVTIRFRGWNDE